MVYVIYLVPGFRNQGIKYLTGHLFPPGVPMALYILVTPIEFVPIFLVRPFSLAVRLFANMMAGHILLTALASAHGVHARRTRRSSPSGRSCSTSASRRFELLVAFLQAYIFTLLTAVYIADSLHPDH